MSFEIVGRLS